MIKNKKSNIISLQFIITLFIVFSSCEKESILPKTQQTTLNILDSVNMLFKDIYLWNNKINNSIYPRNYANSESPKTSLTKFIDDVSLSAINPKSMIPYEFDAENIGTAKYSTYTEHSPFESNKFDFGFSITALPTYGEYRILYVKKKSIAHAKGMKRSDKIIKINGKEILTTNPNTTEFIKSALQNNHIEIELIRANNDRYLLSLTKDQKIYSEILKDTILNINNSNRIGYIALRSFPMLSYIKSELDDVFNTFHENQVKDIIVDLRYNSGGYVSTARYLSNLIVPKILEGKKMYHLEYNNRMQQQRQQYLSNFKVHDVLGYPEYKDDGSLLTYADYDYSEKSNTFYFEKKGKFDGIRNIYFIVSKQTASASELVINNLSAYLPVKLIGKNTYGKPVGYFSIKIGNYSIYLSSFLAYNALNEGEYYNGLNVDFESNDDVSNDFGSLDDPSIKIITNLQQNNISKKFSNIKQESRYTYQYHTPIYTDNENITINDCFKLKK